MTTFGTGYSSLNYLKTFPVSTLKIDLSFIRDIPADQRAIAVVKTVLSLGHGLGIGVVAEGVETAEQFDFLRNSGCDQIQGYYVNRPVRKEEFSDWVRDWNRRSC
ncbi:MAG: EAL domain-containing protein [Pirellulaceae bacterium]